MLSAPYARVGTGRGSGWYGGRVCTVKVFVMGSGIKHLLEVKEALCGAQLKGFQLHSETDKDYDADDESEHSEKNINLISYNALTDYTRIPQS